MKKEMADLIKAGRDFILSLEDANAATHPETGVEYKDVREFRLALDRAAKAVQQ